MAKPREARGPSEGGIQGRPQTGGLSRTVCVKSNETVPAPGEEESGVWGRRRRSALT